MESLDDYNAYGKPSDEPRFRHFRGMCGQCWGWGWVAAGNDAECLHEFQEIAPDQPFACWHTIKCTKCDETRSYSSDD